MLEFLDLILISPFRWIPNAMAGMCLGSFIISMYCVFLGEVTGAILFMANKDYYAKLQKNMVDAHNQSVNALRAGDKDSFQAINRLANEHFGKFFFSQGALGASSLWPVPFALAWYSKRFEGIDIINTPWDIHIGYPFVFISTYILCRIFLGKYVRRLPLLSKVQTKRVEVQEACGRLRSFFADNVEHDL